ncbi:MAG: hypothetical protein KKC77_19425, partial [Proteobacteria bacterium]|nr:hypothetical protein [Pseudomonadota bacterium]
MTKINPKNTIEIVRMYTQEKLSSLKIAKIIGVSKYTILRCLMNNEIKRRSNSESNKGRIGNRRINLTPEQQEEAIRLYSKEFLSTNEIHKKYNLPERPIIRLLKEKGLFKGYNNRMRQLRENGKV